MPARADPAAGTGHASGRDEARQTRLVGAHMATSKKATKVVAYFSTQWRVRHGRNSAGRLVHHGITRRGARQCRALLAIPACHRPAGACGRSLVATITRGQAHPLPLFPSALPHLKLVHKVHRARGEEAPQSIKVLCGDPYTLLLGPVTAAGQAPDGLMLMMLMMLMMPMMMHGSVNGGGWSLQHCAWLECEDGACVPGVHAMQQWEPWL